MGGPVESFHSTVISLFRNEELILPYWVRHHRAIFDHGIMINYGSTDRSVEIIRSMAPGWEVRDSTHGIFDCNLIDRELCEVFEPMAPGWKIVLSSIEFLFVDSVAEFLRSLEGLHENQRAVGLSTLIMADPIPNMPLDLDGQLVQQRFWGREDLRAIRGFRFIHPFHHANYACLGRHATRDPHVIVGWPRLLHYEFSPWPESIDRRAAVKCRMTNGDKATGSGYQHLFERSQQDLLWRCEAPSAADLRLIPEFKATLERFASRHGVSGRYQDSRPVGEIGVGLAACREADARLHGGTRPLRWQSFARYRRAVEDGLDEHFSDGEEVFILYRWSPMGLAGFWVGIKKLGGPRQGDVFMTREENLEQEV